MTRYNRSLRYRRIEKVLQAIILILVLLWLAPHLWNVYGLRPESCVDWANSNPTIGYVEAYDCEPRPFTPVEP